MSCRCAHEYIAKKANIKLESQTTHKATFKQHPIEKAPTFEPPKHISKSYDPDVLQTSYKGTYVKPQILKDNQTYNSSALLQQYHNKSKNAPFYSDTEYKKSFQNHEVSNNNKQAKLEKQPEYKYVPKNTKFQGQSSYKSTFVQKKNQELLNNSYDPTVIKNYHQRKAKLPLENSTAYKDTFKNPNVKLEKQPEYKYTPKNTKFEGQSSYKAQFKQLPKEVYKSDIQYCQVHPGKLAIK